MSWPMPTATVTGAIARMGGAEGGLRDALTRYTTALTGAYYFVPSLQGLRRFAEAAGRWSTARFQARRAASYPCSPGKCCSPS